MEHIKSEENRSKELVLDEEVKEKLNTLLLRQFPREIPREILWFLLKELNKLENMKNEKIASSEKIFKRKINYVNDNIKDVTNPDECLIKMRIAHANYITLITHEYVRIQLSLISVNAILFLNRIMKAWFNAKNSQEILDHREFFIISKDCSMKRATRPYNLMLDYFVMKMNGEGYQPTFKWVTKDDKGCLIIKCQMNK